MSDVKIECKLVIEAKIYKPFHTITGLSSSRSFAKPITLTRLGGDPKTSRRGWCEWMNSYVGTAETAEYLVYLLDTDGEGAFFGYRRCS